MKEHNTIVKKILRHGSLKNYYTTEKYLKRYLEQRCKSGDIFLKQLNYEFITSFEYFIRTTPIRKEDPCSTNGVMKHMERLKKISAWTVKLGYLLKDPFESYQLKFKPGTREFLTMEELQKLETRVFYDLMLNRVQELFIFSC